MVAPIKEYDNVIYTCYNESLKLPNKEPNFKIRCGADGNYEIADNYIWPVCRTDEEHRKPCHCLGDPDITDPEKCKDLEDGQCKAKILLDKLCRNNTLVKNMVTSDFKTNIPLKDRCGVYDLEVAQNPCTSPEEHAENLCYCEQREERGVKDIFQIEFVVKSKLYESDMSYTMSEFGKQKSSIEKSIDEMILKNLNESVVKDSQFVRSQVMMVRIASSVKCRDYPVPPAENGYLYITQPKDDVHLGEMFLFQCERGFWRPADNSTEPFGFPCMEGNDTESVVGEYNLTSIDQKCEADPYYIPGCKVQDRQTPPASAGGLYIDPTNPDNVLVGDTLRYMCPENPNRLGTTYVVQNDTYFYVPCVEDAKFMEMKKNDWPVCREPELCIAANGPEVPQAVKTSGLRDTYTDVLEFQNLTFTCTEASKEPIGNSTVLRLFSSVPDAPLDRVFEIVCGQGGEWITPNETDWPMCMYRDEYSCDPLTEIDQSDAYLASGMKPQYTSFVYKGDFAKFVCNQTGYTTDLGDSINVDCDDNGNFVQDSMVWPVCRPPNCQLEDRPNVNDTFPLTAEYQGDVAVNDFLEFKCPDGLITDEGRSIMLQCIGNKQFEARESWPECRESLICSANDTLPVQSQESIDSGFTCYWLDSEEFLDVFCNCTDPTKVT